MLVLSGHRGRVRSLCFSPDGTRLASVAGREQGPSVWNLADASRVQLSGHEVHVSQVAFSPQGKLLVSVDGYGYLGVWEETDRAPGHVPRHPLRMGAYCFDFTPDGNQVAMLDAIGPIARVRYLDPRRNELRPGPELEWRRGSVLGLAHHPTGRYLAVPRSASEVVLYDLDTREPWINWRHDGQVSAMDFSPGGDTLAVAAGPTICLWDMEGDSRTRLSGHGLKISGVVFTPDGRRLLSCSLDGTVRVWDAGTYQPVAALEWQIGAVRALAVDAAGQRAAVGGDKGQIVVWDLD